MPGIATWHTTDLFLKSWPSTMRVQPSPRNKRSFDEESPTYTRTDRPHAARGIGKAGRRQLGPEIARELGISEAMFHRWKARYGKMSSQEANRLKELEFENARLKKLLAEKELDIDMLKEVSRENF